MFGLEVPGIRILPGNRKGKAVLETLVNGKMRRAEVSTTARVSQGTVTFPQVHLSVAAHEILRRSKRITNTRILKEIG